MQPPHNKNFALAHRSLGELYENGSGIAAGHDPGGPICIVLQQEQGDQIALKTLATFSTAKISDCKKTVKYQVPGGNLKHSQETHHNPLVSQWSCGVPKYVQWSEENGNENLEASGVR